MGHAVAPQIMENLDVLKNYLKDIRDKALWLRETFTGV